MTNRSDPGALVVLGCGALILAVALGIRHGFGLFLQPMSTDNGWGREVFALALATQNLIWGAVQPVTGMIADRFGAVRTMVAGTVLYVAGLLVMAGAGSSFELMVGAGVLVGLGLTGTTFAVVFGVVGRALPPAKRSMAMGVAAAVGSFGQFAMLPATATLISGLGWSEALMALAVVAAVMVPFALPLLRAPSAVGDEAEISVGAALREALAHRGFWLLSFGFFVCGFQVVFIAVHLPSFVTDGGLPLPVATTALALIGLFNIPGTWFAGVLGGRRRKPALLSMIYTLRAVVIVPFAFLPLTEGSVYAFAVAIGLLWLSTVPLTNGTVASVFGVRNLSMLAGIVFFFHQVGAFLGSWLGGLAYDRFGSYDAVWLMAVALSLVAALLNLPIREAPVARLAAAAATP
jgi:predicted MFS family arabinose efflux permease